MAPGADPGLIIRCVPKYELHNSRLTGRGLVESLADHPTDIHVIEDAETLLEDKRAWGVLRSALHSQSKKKPPERRVTWRAHNVNIDIIFTGAKPDSQQARLATSQSLDGSVSHS
jgi:hypothetical protein